jgi:hypothetical protein
MSNDQEDNIKYHIEGIHTKDDAVDYILTQQGFSTDNKVMRMCVEYRQIIDLVDMGAIKKYNDDRYEFIDLTRENLDLVKFPSMTWNEKKRKMIQKKGGIPF